MTITGSGLATGQTADAYDERSELTQEASTRGSGYTDNQVYDGVTSGTTTGPGNLTTLRGNSQAFNADNELTGAGFAYDGDGNPATYKASSLTFDPENRMTACGSSLAAGYTGDGLRAWKQNSSGRTYFLYDGEQAVCELNSSGTVTATNTFGANGLVSRHTSAGSVFYAFDLSGNVAERLTSAGAVASTDLTDGFGARQTTDTTGDPFGFGGQWGGYTDAETGLTLLTHRYYDWVTGRWLTRDPMGYGGGVNLYGYCGNDPVNAVDPSGLQFFVGAPVELGPIETTPIETAPNGEGTIGPAPPIVPRPTPTPIYPPLPGPLPQPSPSPSGSPNCERPMYDCNLIPEGGHDLGDGIYECHYLCESGNDIFIWVITQVGPCENKPPDDIPPPRGPVPPGTPVPSPTGPTYPDSPSPGSGLGGVGIA